MVSQKFLQSIRTSGIPIYKIAYEAGLRPGNLYKITSGIDIPTAGDKRVISVGHVLGLQPEDCFGEEVKR